MTDQQDLIDRLKLEAQMHAQEARTQRATVHEIYQLITGATGEPGDWNGAEPVRQALERIRQDERERCARMADEWSRPSVVKLAAGEMTASELRTAQAVARGLAAAIRSSGTSGRRSDE